MFPVRAVGAAAGLITCSTAFAEVDQAVLMETAGRTHMAIVHFPIALTIAAVIFEAVRILTRRDRPSPAALGCLAIAIAAAAMAATTGWWHADFARRAGESVVEWHRWLGIAGSSLALIALVLGLASLSGTRQALRRLYVLIVVLAAGTIGFAGHKGGEITFGEGYMFELLLGETAPTPHTPSGSSAEVVDLSDLSAVNFDQHILPIFQAACVECHGASKRKGELRLDSLEAFEASPYFNEVVVAGEPTASSLFERITLPETDRDFMPKQGEPLAAREIAIIEQWINSRSESEDPAANSADNGGSDAPIPTPADDTAQREKLVAAIAAVGDRGAHAAFESATSSRLVVNFSVLSRPITAEDLASLMPVADAIVELNLGGVGVTDALLPSVADMVAIERLNLSRSDITDDGIAALTALDRLEVLNVYGSTLTDAAAPTLGSLPALKRIYIWRTSIGDEGRAQLLTAKPDLEIIAGASEPSAAEEQAAPTEQPAAEPETPEGG